MSRELTPEQKLKKICRDIRSELNNWKAIERNGCQDPFWSDGVNMNLERNHIIADKREIAMICEQNGLPIPGEYFTPTPPEVAKDYMAARKREGEHQEKRYKRLMSAGGTMSFKKPKYDEDQLSFM